MNAHDVRHVDVVQQFVVKFDGETGTEENHDLLRLLSVFRQERVQQEQPFVRRTHHVTLHLMKDHLKGLLVSRITIKPTRKNLRMLH